MNPKYTHDFKPDESPCESAALYSLHYKHEDEPGFHIELKDEHGTKSGLYVRNPLGLKCPELGETVELYGRGFGHPVRGVRIGGRLYWYETEDEAQERYAADAVEADKMKRAEFERESDGFVARIAKLPHEFKQRIEAFMSHDPDWGWNFLGYELFACEQAVLIHAAIKCLDGDKRVSGDAFDERMTAFRDMSWDEQKAAVPELDDGHSGNTFAFSCALARLYEDSPEMIVKMHGAMCPLVGCKDYGCYAARIKS